MSTFNFSDKMVFPTGLIVPDLTVKRSIVLEKWNNEQLAIRNETANRERLQLQRAYAGASTDRLTSAWSASNTSADSELLTSLRTLRARSRQLVRDNPYAKNAVRTIIDNVVGQGIGMQAQVKTTSGKLQSSVNDIIEAVYATWSEKDTCHTGGVLSLSEIERLIISQMVTSGEAIIRKIRTPFGSGAIPFALEMIESDLLMDNGQLVGAPSGNAIRMGIEIDKWNRPVAYWFYPAHPGDYQFRTFDAAKFLRVPADEIIHLYVIDRWPQTRGEPWFHSALMTLNNISGYEDAEVTKARVSANIVGFIKSHEAPGGSAVVGGRNVLDTEPGTWQTLLPGEDVAGFNSIIPNAAAEPFLRYMIRKSAVGFGISYESYSGDYSQSNYSSSRMGLLSDRDAYRVIQNFIIRNFRQNVHREFLDAAVLCGALKLGNDYYSNPAKYQAVRFKPRGWSWIDPSKEVVAYKMAVRSGFMTVGDVIAQTSPDSDFEDVFKRREEELDMAHAMGLVLDTDPSEVNDKGQAQGGPVDPGEITPSTDDFSPNGETP